jgi:anti-anti-sigma regulatory factor
MQVKIDTRAKFHAITINERSFSANMTAELKNSLLPILEKEVKSVILNLKDIETLEDAAAIELVKLQQLFYDNNASFVICELRKEIVRNLEKSHLRELMNITLTSSEAADIIHMEEIEREFLD